LIGNTAKILINTAGICRQLFLHYRPTQRTYRFGNIASVSSMPPSFPAMLLETGLSLSIFEITDVGEYAATSIVATPGFPRPVAP
jgi:hypothetical protein